MAHRGTDDQAQTVTAAADQLYGLRLDEFTAARNDRAKQARARGGKDAAAAIASLAKPNAIAWLANQLARQHAGEIRQLLDLGNSMRRATASLDAGQLRELSGQQRQVIAALVQHAQTLAAAAGQAVSDSTARGLEDTLHAALADDQAGRQLAQGQLTSGLASSGFPGMTAADASAWAATAPAPARQPATTPADASAARRGEAAQAARAQRAELARQARRDSDDAGSAAARTGQVRDQARAALRQAEHAARESAATTVRLRVELDAAVQAQARADRARDLARRDADLAATAALHAERRLAEATARRKKLER